MKKFLKSFLYKSLGLKNYLKLLHKTQALVIDYGVFKNNDSLFTYHFAKKLIQKGDTIVDIGANLGYFTRLFSHLTGPEGRVYAIEPVKPFFETLTWALSSRNNITFYNYALGTENRNIQLSVPDDNHYIRTGLPKVVDNNSRPAGRFFLFDAQMVRASELLADIPTIDFIKCDIEGYERYVIPEIAELLSRHKPIVQIESGGDSLITIGKTFKELGFEQYVCRDGRLYPHDSDQRYPFDFYFIHPENNKVRYLMD